MKKTYIKPVMESEMFLANEYVAACWEVTCHGASGYLEFMGQVFHQPHGEVASKLKDEPIFGKKTESWWLDPNRVYTFDSFVDENGVEHYDVTKIDKATREHPNAS